MNKHKAQTVAREERLTWSELLALVNNCQRPDNEVSVLNPQITVAYSRDLFRKICLERDQNEKPKAWRLDVYSRHPGAVKPSRDFLIVTNILREFGIAREAMENPNG